ncbi:MAG: SMR family transporter [Candidatus Endonucleobacter sp. (ex Gigantidas childressi)]|nr:SMR family transporter [Candidatus Endonucleobacter sp. (ex Gigantidas childressi)]
MQFIINHFYILLAILFGVASQLIIKWQMSEYSFDHYETMCDKFLFAFSMLFNPYIIISLTLTLLSGITWMVAMIKFDISYAYPFTALGFVCVFALSVILFNEPVNWQKIMGLGFIVIGLIISSKGG